MKLTDTRIRTLKAGERPKKYADGNGLYLEIRPAAGSERVAKLWRYRYRLGGKENLYAIGSYPDVSLAQAREERKAARDLVKQGIHPAHHRKEAKLRSVFEHANTFAAVGKEWLAANKGHWAPKTHRHRERLLEADVFPHIGSLPMRQVTPTHAHQVVGSIQKRAPQMAVVALQAITAISHLGIATGRADVDLGYPLRRSVRTKATQHKKPMRPNEIPAFFSALENYSGSPMIKAAIHLLWYTLARPSEVIGAKLEEFDLDGAIWEIPKERTKMRRSHAVPLPTQAVMMLRAVFPFVINTGCLLPNRKNPRRPASPGILNKAFVSMGYEGKFSAHAVRVTGRTILGEQGHPRDVLERQLAHREKKEVRAYDQGDRLEARRVVMQGWADYLDGLRKGGAELLSFHPRRA
jgi:integrase